MCDITPRVSEEQLPLVLVTPYHLHNSVNLPRHLLHSTLHQLLGGACINYLCNLSLPLFFVFLHY